MMPRPCQLARGGLGLRPWFLLILGLVLVGIIYCAIRNSLPILPAFETAPKTLSGQLEPQDTKVVIARNHSGHSGTRMSSFSTSSSRDTAHKLRTNIPTGDGSNGSVSLLATLVGSSNTSLTQGQRHEVVTDGPTLSTVPWCSPELSPLSSGANSKVWNTNNPVWVKVNAKTLIFSAYFDNTLGPVVVVLGFEDRREKISFFCLVTFSNDSEICLTTPAVKLEIPEDVGQYEAYFYICKLPKNSDVPQYVMLSTTRNCQLQSPRTTRVPVSDYSKPDCMKKFGVCVEGPLHNMADPQTVAESLEMNRILGVDFFTVYVHSASSEVLQLLQEYAKEGLADVVNWKPRYLYSAHYYGQDGLINDCLYRNMHRVKYLLFIDLDEFVVPQRHFVHNLSQLMDEIDNKSLASFKIQHVFFYTSNDKGSPPSSCGESSKRKLEAPRISSFLYRFKYPSPPHRTKPIVKPAFTRMVGIHVPRKPLQGYTSYEVPSAIALLHHYRLPPGRRRGVPLVLDRRMAEFAPALMKALKARLCRR